MSAASILIVLFSYFAVLVIVSLVTSRKADNDTFFLGNKKSPWYLVAFGMIGASLSGITFLSIPGKVGGASFGYMQVVLGYLLGYVVIAYVLMPIYYRLNLTTIYGYLKIRHGVYTYKTGAFFFLISRLLGSTIRLYLVALILQQFMFSQWGIPFYVSMMLSIVLIWVYTFKGGIKTIVWTDTLQTLFMLLALIFTVYSLLQSMDLSITKALHLSSEKGLTKIFFMQDALSPGYFWKDFIGGAFLAICMTGLDQDMMQKNLSCKNIGDAQKNMMTFAIVLIFVNLLFLFLGALLYLYNEQMQLGFTAGDMLFANISMGGHAGTYGALLFIIGLVAAAYSSADSAFTALTTSVCVDFLEIDKKTPEQQIRFRKYTHIGVMITGYFTILLVDATMDRSAIDFVLKIAGYTYGPLLGIFFFGILTNRKIKDSISPIICVISPALTFFAATYSPVWFNGYVFGYELLLLNGLITFFGLYLFSKRPLK